MFLNSLLRCWLVDFPEEFTSIYLVKLTFVTTSISRPCKVFTQEMTSLQLLAKKHRITQKIARHCLDITSSEYPELSKDAIATILLESTTTSRKRPPKSPPKPSLKGSPVLLVKLTDTFQPHHYEYIASAGDKEYTFSKTSYNPSHGHLKLGRPFHKGIQSYVFDGVFVTSNNTVHDVVVKVSLQLQVGSRMSSVMSYLSGDCNNHGRINKLTPDVAPKFFGCFSDINYSPLYFYVTEKHGTSLHHVLHTQLLSDKQAIDYISQVRRLLVTLQQKAFIVHLDVKPGNIVVHNDTVKLIDFGTSQDLMMLGMGVLKEELVGTLRYLPIDGHLKKSKRVQWDFESLAYSLEELLVGRVPWQDDDNLDKVLKMKREFVSDYKIVNNLLKVSRAEGPMNYDSLQRVFPAALPATSNVSGSVVKVYGKDFGPTKEEEKRFYNPAYTLSTNEVTLDEHVEHGKVYTRTHDDGWTISGEAHEDWYEWVEDFNATHPVYGKVAGDFGYEVTADSEEAYQHFVKHHEAYLWDKGDI